MEKVCNFQDDQEDVKVVKDKSEEELLLTTSCVTTNTSTKDWIIGIDCINHITHDRKFFKELKKSYISKVRIGNGEQLNVRGTRKISIKTHSGIKLVFYVLYVFEITQNRLSIAQMLEKRYKVYYENKLYVIKDAKSLEVFKVHMKDKAYALDLMKEELTTNEKSIIQ